MMKSLFLQAPSFDGYDGGAGARYQMKREVKSFWFPTWLAQAAANLFSFLRTADLVRPRAIAVAPIPEHGLGEAINDRLSRAAGKIG